MQGTRNLSSTYYSYEAPETKKSALNDLVAKLFNENQHVYGTLNLKAGLAKKKHTVSRRKIAKIMRFNGLASAYTIKKYRVHKSTVNNEQQPNIVDRQFNGEALREVIVSDSTYICVGNNWNYICVILDLHNREIVGYICGRCKNAQLIYDALATVKSNLNSFYIFHTDHGSKFKNYLIDDLLKEFSIRRQLNAKGYSYDNAVTKVQFKIIKTEFVCFREFENIEHLKTELLAYVYWFNNKRIHGSLGYKSPVEFKQSLL